MTNSNEDREVYLENKIKNLENMIDVLKKRNVEIWEDYNNLQFHKALWKPKCYATGAYDENDEDCDACPASVGCRVLSEMKDVELEGTDDA
jgi:hypothetical protein